MGWPHWLNVDTVWVKVCWLVSSVFIPSALQVFYQFVRRKV